MTNTKQGEALKAEEVLCILFREFGHSTVDGEVYDEDVELYCRETGQESLINIAAEIRQATPTLAHQAGEAGRGVDVEGLCDAVGKKAEEYGARPIYVEGLKSVIRTALSAAKQGDV